MPHLRLSRVAASLLLLVFMITGGLRALDAAMYHRDGGAPGAGVARLLAHDAPKAHYDQCVLGAELRGSSAPVTGTTAPTIHTTVCFRAPILQVRAPRSAPFRTTSARAPPALPV